ncbi:hypothetical protein K437DRAFT_256109 [Tilletiaria anomala UBC 951]|uniref:Uncharacterized protein n=1 Tax=Tilletiaria anomala (strain ATCC 24038 / CBS 436.72 / UBC 951) TaxID=1037660 RepID=A0A066W2S5_TILAU|nr:uncharacterized protein K437DRAFT_256109 [Tilletiaria anomala UBC 951]KDN46828.1 hypothetical protein K437DRAFT_256109 [Tilletiaria anomala UBC 951]
MPPLPSSIKCARTNVHDCACARVPQKVHGIQLFLSPWRLGHFSVSLHFTASSYPDTEGAEGTGFSSESPYVLWNDLEARQGRFNLIEVEIRHTLSDPSGWAVSFPGLTTENLERTPKHHRPAVSHVLVRRDTLFSFQSITEALRANGRLVAHFTGHGVCYQRTKCENSECYASLL